MRLLAIANAALLGAAFCVGWVASAAFVLGSGGGQARRLVTLCVWACRPAVRSSKGRRHRARPAGAPCVRPINSPISDCTWGSHEERFCCHWFDARRNPRGRLARGRDGTKDHSEDFCSRDVVCFGPSGARPQTQESAPKAQRGSGSEGGSGGQSRRRKSGGGSSGKGDCRESGG